ncbi:hypothetical protein AB0D13_09905 [Streptomyces sp. NPDC048430]|uniref:hypothetical protein n=1 Tax=Streptomyces sp. NPDC048430 TaxID=3155388 RepID=UPI00341844BF
MSHIHPEWVSSRNQQGLMTADGAELIAAVVAYPAGTGRLLVVDGRGSSLSLDVTDEFQVSLRVSGSLGITGVHSAAVGVDLLHPCAVQRRVVVESEERLDVVPFKHAGRSAAAMPCCLRPRDAVLERSNFYADTEVVRIAASELHVGKGQAARI